MSLSRFLKTAENLCISIDYVLGMYFPLAEAPAPNGDKVIVYPVCNALVGEGGWCTQGPIILCSYKTANSTRPTGASVTRKAIFRPGKKYLEN